MGDIIQWIVGGAFALILLLLGIEKGKTKKERKAKEKAEDERDQYKVVNKVYQDADQIKDELVQKKAELAREEKEVVQSIASIPEEKEVPLSEDIKKLAADQYTRARARTSCCTRPHGRLLQGVQRHQGNRFRLDGHPR